MGAPAAPAALGPLLALAWLGGTAWQLQQAALWRAWPLHALTAVGLTPLTMLFFQQVSVVGFVANLVAMPLVTLLTTPLALLGLLLPPLRGLAGALVQGLTTLLQWLALWPLAV